MRRIAAIFVLSFISCLAFAQLKNVTFHKGEVITVKFDYSQLERINNLPYEDFCQMEDDYEQGFKDAEKRFLSTINSHTARLTFSIASDKEHVLIVYPTTIKDNGTFKGFAKVFDKEGNELGSIDDIWVSGGTFGSFFNLMGDGYESAAEKIYMKLVKRVK